MQQLILIGDSIRMGYQADVIRELTELADVWAPTQNGGNSANILQHLDEWIISRSPDVVHINCGLHDLKKDFDAAELAIPINQYESNLRAFLGRIWRKPIALSSGRRLRLSTKSGIMSGRGSIGCSPMSPRIMPSLSRSQTTWISRLTTCLASSRTRGETAI